MRLLLGVLLVCACHRPASVHEWGIEPLSLRPTFGGSMLDFRYRVVDANKALPLFDRKRKAYLIEPESGQELILPEDAQPGALRHAPVAGESYYVLFGNGKGIVKRGSRVTVVFGPCRLDDLEVD